MRNVRLALFSVMLCLSAHGQNWTQTTAPALVWLSITGAQHGSNMVAVAYSDSSYMYPGQIYASTNGGVTWTPTSAPSNYWFSIATSTNGLRLVAGSASDETGANNSGQIFISTNGSLTWTASSAPMKSWFAVASSADGQVLAGAAYNDGIYISTNAGATWNASDAPADGWQALAIAATGVKMYAAAQDGIHVSTNSGATWNLAATSPLFCVPIVCSADGSQIFTGTESITGGGIYISTNSGATWDLTSAPVNNYQSLSISTYGDILLAGVFSGDNTLGPIYLSTDAGSTWNEQTAPTNSWGCVFCSADGSLLTAGEFGGSIYSASNPLTHPKLTIKATAQNSIVSWPLFPAGFQLQVTSTLNPPVNWTNTVSSIVQLGTNYYTTNGLASPGAYFRLARP